MCPDFTHIVNCSQVSDAFQKVIKQEKLAQRSGPSLGR